MRSSCDGGRYGWLVVGICFVVYFMGFGPVQVSGLFYADILSLYGVDRRTASMPFLIGSVARAVSGPFCGFLSHAFGYRVAIVLGCLLSSFGIFGCFFAQEITVLAIFWTIYGFGFGMSIAALPQVINLFNKKHASKATGISLCGTPIAGIVLPLLTVRLLDTYALQGTLLIFSSIMLNTLPGLLLLRDPKSAIRHRERQNGESTPPPPDLGDRPEDQVSNTGTENGVERVERIFKYCDEEKEYEEHAVKRSVDETFENKNSIEVLKTDCSNKTTQEILEHQRTNIPIPNTRPSKRKGNYCYLFKIFCDPLFLSFSFARSVCGLLYLTIPTIFIDFSIDKGVPKDQAPYTLVAYGLADLFGKTCLGWITDGNYISRASYASVCFVAIALSCFLMTCSNGLATMTVAIVVEAIGIASGYTVLLVLACHYLDKDTQSVAIPSLDIFLLPMSLATTQLIGYFRDILRSYDGLAYTFSAASIICAILMHSIPKIYSWKEKKKETDM